MKHHKILFYLFIVPLFAFSTHKYYVSLTQITFKKEAKAVQIIINVFMDDIELALNKDYKIDLQLTTKKELKNNDVYFEKYLKDKLDIIIDGKTKEFNYLGKEYDGELVFFYLEIENIERATSFKVTNKILLKHFPDQKNLVKTKVDKKNRSIILTKDQITGTLNHY